MIRKNSVELYSHLNLEDISDVDETNAKRVCKDF